MCIRDRSNRIYTGRRLSHIPALRRWCVRYCSGVTPRGNNARQCHSALRTASRRHILMRVRGGPRFWFLPAADFGVDCMSQRDSASPAGAAPQTSRAEPANTESFLPQSTVLIVDDNPQNVELLQAFLESLPVKLVTAADGVEALAKVVEHHPDLILLDIMMPHMSGFQVCKRLKACLL